MDTTKTRVDDFYTKLVGLIEAEDFNAALKIFNTLDNQTDRITTLKSLSATLDNAIARADVLSRDYISPNVLANNLSHAQNYARELQIALENSLSLAFSVERIRPLIFKHSRSPDQSLANIFLFTRPHDRAIDIQIALDLAIVHARTLDELEHPVNNELIEIINQTTRYTTFLIKALENEISGRNFYYSELLNPISRTIRTTFLGIQQLTVHLFSDEVVPYLQAMVELQMVLSELQGSEFVEPAIKELSQNSPFSVGFSGTIGDAITAITAFVIPWRRQHAKQIADLEVVQKQTDIVKTQAEIREIAVKAQPENPEKEAIELDRAREEVRKMRLENEKAQLDLYKAKIELGVTIIEQYAPQLSEQERLMYIHKLLKPLNVLGESRLEIAPGDGRV